MSETVTVRQRALEITNWLHDEGFIDKEHVSHRRITNRIERAIIQFAR